MSSRTIPNLGAVIGLSPLAQVWINQDGTDYRATAGDIARLPGSSSTGVLITASGVTLNYGTYYGVRTSLGAFTGTLPQLAYVPVMAYLEIADVDNNAGINNYTVNAFSGDQIADHGVLSSSTILNVSNTITRITRSASSWTVITYGM